MMAEMRELIDRSKLISSLARQILEEVDKTDQYHRELGFQGMANRHAVLTRERPEEYEKLRDEYTDAALENMRCFAELHSLIEGIVNGTEECIKAKKELGN